MGSGSSSGGQGGLGRGPLAALEAGREVAVLPLLPPPPGSYLPRAESRAVTVAEPLAPLASRPGSPAQDSGARPRAAGGGRGGGGPRPEHRPGAEGK